MKKIILPFKSPILTTYPTLANPLSIFSNYEETYPWIMNNFIQLISWHKQFINYYDFFYKNCPLINYNTINKCLVKIGWDSLTKFIMDSIDNGFYVYLVVNTKYISAYGKYRSGPHDMMIYGYCKDKEIFYIADNFLNNIYAYQTCTFKELSASVNNLTEADETHLGYNHCIELISYRKNNTAIFDLGRVKESISDYLNSKPTEKWDTLPVIWTEGFEKHNFGISCYETIYLHLNFLRNNKTFDNGALQSFHLQWEHKKMMVRRIEFLNKNKLISDGTTYLNEYSKIADSALACRNLLIKYAMANKEGLLDNIIDRCKDIQLNEERILEKMLISI